MIAATKTKEAVKTRFDRSCEKCGHVKVCVVHRALLSLLAKHFTDETRPFEAADLANICKAYFSASVLSRLQET